MSMWVVRCGSACLTSPSNLVALTGVLPDLVGFPRDIGQKIVEVITSPILNQFGRNFGQFWVFWEFWRVWDRFQSQQRSSSAIFASGKLGEPSGPWEKWSCIGLYFTVWGEIKAILTLFLSSEFNFTVFSAFLGIFLTVKPIWAT